MATPKHGALNLPGSKILQSALIIRMLAETHVPDDEGILEKLLISPAQGRSIELRLGVVVGKLIGNCKVENTGGQQT